MFIAVYVDDIVVAASRAAAERLHSNLSREYKLKAMEPLHCVLGMRVVDSGAGDKDRTISVDQSQYALTVLDRFAMSNANPQSTPMDPSLRLSADMKPQTDDDRSEMEKVPYREAVGSLMWLACGSRHDLAFSVCQVAKHCSDPGPTHWKAVKRILRYLRGTVKLGLCYRKSELGDFSGRVSLSGFVDADWGSNVDDRKSVCGFAFGLGSGPISWSYKKQKSVALSTAEAEYVAASLATQELLYMRNVLHGVRLKVNTPMSMAEDNQACLRILDTPSLHTRAKHIDLRYHFVRDHVLDGTVAFQYCPSEDNVADIFTKPLPRDLFVKFRNAMLTCID